MKRHTFNASLLMSLLFVLNPSQAQTTYPTKAVKLMVELGGDVNEARPGGGTALHTATRFGDHEMIQFLVDRGADLNAKDRFGRNVLQEAEFEAPKPTIEFIRKLTQK